MIATNEIQVFITTTHAQHLLNGDQVTNEKKIESTITCTERNFYLSIYKFIVLYGRVNDDNTITELDSEFHKLSLPSTRINLYIE